MKITFYSTSPKEEGKSKYPKQLKTSYTVPDNTDTGISFAKPLKKARRAQNTAGQQATKQATRNQESKPNTEEQTGASRSGRVLRRPQRYEPCEVVTDDFNDHSDSDSGYSSEN